MRFWGRCGLGCSYPEWPLGQNSRAATFPVQSISRSYDTSTELQLRGVALQRHLRPGRSAAVFFQRAFGFKEYTPSLCSSGLIHLPKSVMSDRGLPSPSPPASQAHPTPVLSSLKPQPPPNNELSSSFTLKLISILFLLLHLQFGFHSGVLHPPHPPPPPPPPCTSFRLMEL